MSTRHLRPHPSAPPAMHVIQTCALACLAAALAHALVLLQPSLAEAADGCLRVVRNQESQTSYAAYQLFAADVSADGHASHLEWASDVMRESVLAFIDAHGYDSWLKEEHPQDGQHEVPQNAAEYLALMIEGSLADAVAGDAASAQAKQEQAAAAAQQTPAASADEGSQASLSIVWQDAAEASSTGQPAAGGRGSASDAAGSHAASDTRTTAAPSASTASEDASMAVRTVAPRTTAGSSFAHRLAQTLAANTRLGYDVVKANETFEATQGLWLLVSLDASLAPVDDAGTAPLFVPVGDAPLEIVEKASVPLLAKQVQEDSTGAWGTTADAHVGQDMSFRLQVTLPSSLTSYDHYHLAVTDTLSEGLRLSANGQAAAQDVSVRIADKAVPSSQDGLSVRAEGQALVVDIADVLAEPWLAMGIGPNATIVIEYRAHLAAGCAVGAQGNPSEATLAYTNNPVTHAEGRTHPVLTKVFTYALTLHKRAAEGSASLPGARFTIRSADKEDADRPYVQQDGSLAAKPHEFETGSDGTVRVQGVDEGSFVINEVAAPAGYRRSDEDMGVTLTSELDQLQLALSQLSARLDAPAAQLESVEAGTGNAIIGVTNEPLPPTAATGGAPRKTSTIERLAQTGVGPIAQGLLVAAVVTLALAGWASHRLRPHKRRPSFSERHLDLRR